MAASDSTYVPAPTSKYIAFRTDEEASLIYASTLYLRAKFLELPCLKNLLPEMTIGKFKALHALAQSISARRVTTDGNPLVSPSYKELMKRMGVQKACVDQTMNWFRQKEFLVTRIVGIGRSNSLHELCCVTSIAATDGGHPEQDQDRESFGDMTQGRAPAQNDAETFNSSKLVAAAGEAAVAVKGGEDEKAELFLLLVEEGIDPISVKKILSLDHGTPEQFAIISANADLRAQIGKLDSRAGYIRSGMLEKWPAMRGTHPRRQEPDNQSEIRAAAKRAEEERDRIDDQKGIEELAALTDAELSDLRQRVAAELPQLSQSILNADWRTAPQIRGPLVAYLRLYGTPTGQGVEA